MTIEKHAEALVKDMLYRTFPADGPDANDIAETHIQFAIDEATAPLKARIAELEGLRELIEQYGDVRAHIGTEDGVWHDQPAMWQQMLNLKAHIEHILKGGAS